MRWARPTAIDRAREIISMLLRHLRATVSSDGEELEQHLYFGLGNALSALEKAEAPKAYAELAGQVKGLLHAQREIEEQRVSKRLAALRRLLVSLTASVAGVTEHTDEFMRDLSAQVEQIIRVAAMEKNLALHEELDAELRKLGRLIARRREQEYRLISALHERTAQLEQELDHANEELRIDALTRLHNRRALEARLLEDLAQYNQFGGEFALLLFDIDHFKQVNDRHGHIVGDRILQALADVARQVFRRMDFVARYGGEEFVAVLYDTGPLYAQKTAERFRLSVARKSFQYESGGQQRSLQITVSIGIAQFKPGDTPEELLLRADEALYRAKGLGRNQVQMWRP